MGTSWAGSHLSWQLHMVTIKVEIEVRNSPLLAAFVLASPKSRRFMQKYRGIIYAGIGDIEVSPHTVSVGGIVIASRVQSPTRPVLCLCRRSTGWMAACSRSRAVSALVKHAKKTFEKCTEETNLVAPTSPSPPELILE